MSSYWKTIHEGLIIPQGPEGYPGLGGNQTWYPPSVMKWDPSLEWVLMPFFNGISYPYRKSDMTVLQEPLRSNIYRFLLALDGYLEQERPRMSPKDILNGVLKGPCYATYLKRLRWKAFINTTYGVPQEFPSWWDEIPKMSPVRDIGEIFNYQYLPHWEESIDDYKEGFSDLNIDQDTLQKFKETLRNLLPESYPGEIIDPREILLDLSGSSTTLPQSDKKLVNWRAKKSVNQFSKRIGKGLRTVVQVHPEGARDTVILSVSSINTIRLIDRQVCDLLETTFSESLQIRDEEELQKNLKSFFKKHDFFLERDFEKEGITKPRELLKAMLEVLKSVYPDVPAFRYTDFYDDFHLQLEDGTIVFPKRGHGLGMANSLTTLMQVVIHYMVLCSEESLQFAARDRIHMRCLNDDNVSGFSCEEDQEIYWDIETGILEALGLKVKPSKSRRTFDGFCVIERYFFRGLPTFNKKESYKRRELLACLGCVNITQAKQVFSSAAYSSYEYVKDYIQEIAYTWGYEFFPDEWRYPSSCGGWYTPSIKGVTLEAKLLEKLPYNGLIYSASRACRFNKTFRRRPGLRKIEFIPPIQKLYPLLTEQCKELYYGNEEEIYNLFYKPSHNPNLSYYEWEQLRKLRQRTFSKIWKIVPDFYSFMDEMISHLETDYIPPDFTIERWCDTEDWMGPMEDWYSSTNPKISWAASQLRELESQFIFPNSYAIKCRITDQVNHGLTAAIRKQLGRQIDSRLPDLCLGQMTEGFRIPKEPCDQQDFFERYITPKRVGKAYMLLGYLKVPIPYKKYTNQELINEKKKVFGKILSPQEEDLAQLLKQKLNKVNTQKLIRAFLQNKLPLEEFRRIEIDYPQEPKITDQDDDELSSTDQQDNSDDSLKYQATEEGFWSWYYEKPRSTAPYVEFDSLRDFVIQISLRTSLVNRGDDYYEGLYNHYKERLRPIFIMILNKIWKFSNREDSDLEQEDYELGDFFGS